MVVDYLLKLAPSAGTMVLVVVGLFVVHRYVLRAHTASTGKKFRNQMIMLGLSAVGALLLLLTLPIGDQRLGQILSLIGIVLSAGIALSSTTLLGNAMAGFMIRAVRAFRPGEFIELGEHFGRVSDIGLFHVEIQTEDRDLKTLPNLLFMTNAVKRIRPSGTILSAQVSLGYDAPPSRILNLLVQAAEQAGLKEPFARVIELADHAVTYKVAGLLEDVTRLLAKRSELRVAIMHVLHADGVEIVSPQFRNTRLLEDGKSFIPPLIKPAAGGPAQPTSGHIVFDKAEEAASLESLRQSFADLEKQRDKLRQALKGEQPGGAAGAEEELARVEQQLARLDKVIAARTSRAAEKE